MATARGHYIEATPDHLDVDGSRVAVLVVDGKPVLTELVDMALSGVTIISPRRSAVRTDHAAEVWPGSWSTIRGSTRPLPGDAMIGGPP
ncbi:hypothetical protein AB0C34_01820 [Nocardia sp. NPDC049220]|uniref:hypothetical protein n=1 Tax=Nocardia sp. NPDC049220 TaxID=3155273 RepID=UPI0033DA7D32